MRDITISTIRSLSDDYVTDGMRETLPQWLLLASDQVQELVWQLPFKELSAAAYDILENNFGKGHASERIHISFWTEYEESGRTKQRFSWNNVIGGICSSKAFQLLCQRESQLVAWLLTPPNTYSNRLLEMSLIGEERMLEIMQASPVQPNGKVDSRLALAQIKLWEVLQDRLKGSVTQNINQKSVNVNVNSSPAGTEKESFTSVEQIQARLKELQEKAERLTSPAPIRVDAVKLIQPNLVKDDDASK
jgi:hypothetical protein